MASCVASLRVSPALAPSFKNSLAPTTSGQAFMALAPPSTSRIVMSVNMPQKQHNVGGAVALALLAATIIPEIAEAATPGVSPSLKNLLLSVVAGGTVLTAIGVAVAGVSTFDPVKRS